MYVLLLRDLGWNYLMPESSLWCCNGSVAREDLRLNLGVCAGYTALIYSGDADSVVPHTGTERWIGSLQLPVVSPWQAWFYPDPALLGSQVIA